MFGLFRAWSRSTQLKGQRNVRFRPGVERLEGRAVPSGMGDKLMCEHCDIKHEIGEQDYADLVCHDCDYVHVLGPQDLPQ